MDIGQCIKTARKNADLTQEQLAKLCNLATITIRQYELNKREPRFEQLQNIAEVLNIHILDLLQIRNDEKFNLEIKIDFDSESFAEKISEKHNIPL